MRVSASTSRAREKQTARLAAASAAFVVPGGTGAPPPARTARIAAGSEEAAEPGARARSSSLGSVRVRLSRSRRCRAPSPIAAARGRRRALAPPTLDASSASSPSRPGRDGLFARVPAEVPAEGGGEEDGEPASGDVACGSERRRAPSVRLRGVRLGAPGVADREGGEPRAPSARGARAGAPASRRAAAPPRRRRAASSYRCPARHRASATSLSAARSRRRRARASPGRTRRGMRARRGDVAARGAHGGAAVRVRRRARRALGGVAEQGGRGVEAKHRRAPDAAVRLVEGGGPSHRGEVRARRVARVPRRDARAHRSRHRGGASRRVTRIPRGFILASPSGRPTRVAPHTRVPRSPESPIRVTSVSRTSLG